MSSGVQLKLLTYEVTPPPGVWNKIAAELDESEIDHVFPNTLYTAEIIPPTGIWNKIQLTLNTEEKPLQQSRRIPLLRYAAAVMFIGLVAWGGFQLLNKKSGDKEIAVNEKTDPSPKDDYVSTPHIIPEQITSNATASTTNDPEEARNDKALEASKRTFARLDLRTANHRLKNIAAAYRFNISTEKENYTGVYFNPDEYLAGNADRYISILNTEGHNIRISKKLGNLICCVSGDEETKDCKTQISQWREKIANSGIGHSAGSFLDVFSLISSIPDQ